METAAVSIAALGIDLARVPVVTRDQVKYAKPNPDIFITAAARLNVPIESSLVIGDAIWDMLAARRARAFGGAARIYAAPADLLRHLDQFSIRR